MLLEHRPIMLRLVTERRQEVAHHHAVDARLHGQRLQLAEVENLGELQSLAVKAGINGVMMGNFLTTLGNEPEHDRAMFEEHGLNVARQADNGSNPRPDNRSGWLEGETPDVVDEFLDASRAAAATASVDLEIRLWDPSSQL